MVKLIPNLHSPGVYVSEVDIFPNRIEPTHSAVPLFIGYTSKAEDATGRNLTNRPFKVGSLGEFEKVFGGAIGSSLSIDIKEYRSTVPDTSSYDFTLPANCCVPDFLLYYAIKLFFDNGGVSCIVVSIGDGQATEFEKKRFIDALGVLKHEPEINLVVIPDIYSRLFDKDSTASSGRSSAKVAEVIDEALSACSQQQNCFWLGDIPNAVAASQLDVKAVKDFVSELRATEQSKAFGALYFPFLRTQYPAFVDWPNVHVGKHIMLKDDARGSKVETEGRFTDTSLADKQVRKAEPVLIAQLEMFLHTYLAVDLPASAAMAGIMCAVDTQRGIWKAPANIQVQQVSAPCIEMDEQDYSQLVMYADGATNIIKSVPEKGIMVWGARTLAPDTSEWRYISIRRCINWISESVHLSLMAFVFEPNNPTTWRNMEKMISDFLFTLWKQGALQGQHAEHAFFVKIGLGETMTQNDIANNRIIIRLGIALQRPAEFIILRLDIPSAQ